MANDPDRLGEFRVIDADIIPLASEEYIRGKFNEDDAEAILASGEAIGPHGYPIGIKRLPSGGFLKDFQETFQAQDFNNLCRLLDRDSPARKIWDVVNGVSPDAYIIRTPDGSFLIDPARTMSRSVSPE